VVISSNQALARTHALVALEYKNFRLYWAGQFLTQVGTTMQQTAVAWQVYLLTHSAAALGLIGLFRVIPILLFSLGGGVVADAVDRRKLLLALQPVLLVTSAVLAVATASGNINLWLIYTMIAAAASAYSFVSPAQQALVPSLVPRERLTNALSLNTTTFQLATVLGPSLAGVVIAAWGVGTVYFVDVASFFGPIVALSFIRIPPVLGAIQGVTFRAAVEGLQFVRHTPIIVYTMGLDFIATFFGSATALLPIFARDILHAGAQGYGVLYASPAIGAVAAGVLMSIFGTRIARKGLVILGAVGVYAGCTIGFGLSNVFALSVVALSGAGAADTVSMILRQTLRQSITPNELRGRMTSVNMIFFMGGPQLGEVEAGLVARAFGAPFSIVSGGLGALLGTCLIAYSARALRQYRD
jgi:MFS family permease